jgi:phosphoribosylglycinamide formyltransferase-1
MNLGVLVSGRGSNLGAVLDACASGALPARVAVVASNKAGVPGLARAAEAGVPTRVVPHVAYPDRASFDAALVEALCEAGVEHVVLAGFMRLLTPVFLDAFPNRVVNIHPSLLPAFPGVDAQGQALAYGARVTGCTVHFVDAGTDTGPILAQAVVPVLEGDDRDTLAARILAREHELLVRVLGWIARGLVEVLPPAAPGAPGARSRVHVRGERTFFGVVAPEAEP